MSKVSKSVYLMSRALAKRWLPERSQGGNKTQGGRVYILASEEPQWGAQWLAAKAAFAVGAGYVVLIQPKNIYPSVDLPEAQVCSDQEFFKTSLKPNDCVLIGPGAGVGPRTKKFLLWLSKKKLQNVVIDADAITVMAQLQNWIFPSCWIMTPHTGELSRVLGVPAQDIELNRSSAARWASVKTKMVVLLKGHLSVVSNSQFQIVIPSGNKSLAKAGTGDVLAGMVAALRSQGLGPEKAVSLAAYLHGLCADRWLSEGNDHLSFSASLLIESIPKVVGALRS